MKSPLNTPLDQFVAQAWNKIDTAYKNAFFFVFAINVMAFGFEMTNLTVHHDDVGQILMGNIMIQMNLGRVGFGWLHYYVQASHVMPFIQMLQGIVYMSLYGMVTAHLWGARRTADMTLIGAILCVFPYFGQMFQYNTSMATYPLAHLLGALAVLLSVRATAASAVSAAVLYALAFSIYQSVIANSATIFLIWAVGFVLYGAAAQRDLWRSLLKSAGAAVVSVALGGAVYLAMIKGLGIELDSYQGVDKALSVGEAPQIGLAFREIIAGSRSFFLWPENYLPGSLKTIQLLLMMGAGLACLWIPKTWTARISAGLMLVLATFSPRILQLVHPQGWYHNLTLTAYAVTIAGACMLLVRSPSVPVRNASLLLALVLVGGYVVNCNWMSTVNQLNTMAHYSAMTQILARLRSIPAEGWDGKTIVAVGHYGMRTDYPFKRTTGVASRSWC